MFVMIFLVYIELYDEISDINWVMWVCVATQVLLGVILVLNTYLGRKLKKFSQERDYNLIKICKRNLSRLHSCIIHHVMQFTHCPEVDCAEFFGIYHSYTNKIQKKKIKCHSEQLISDDAPMRVRQQQH